MPVRLRVVGLKELRGKIAVAKESLDDYEELWDMVTQLMIEVEEELFDTEGATAIPMWPPLAESTIERKTREGLPLVPMIATGALRDSLTSPEAGQWGQGRTSIGTFGEKEFSWGTEVTNDRGQMYAGYHQDPRFSPEHTDPDNPPIRNVVNVTPELLVRLDRLLDDFVNDAMREAGIG